MDDENQRSGPFSNQKRDIYPTLEGSFRDGPDWAKPEEDILELRSVIIDDEKQARSLLREMLTKHCPEVEIVGEADAFESGVACIQKHIPDLVFLDIQLPPKSGFDILKAFDPPFPFQVIFVSAFDRFAAHAFRVSAVDFLVKPLAGKDLMEAVRKVKEINFQAETLQKLELLISNLSGEGGKPEKIYLPTIEGFEVREIAGIARCEANGSYTDIYFIDGDRCTVSKGLIYYTRLLIDHGFFRCHNSHLINLNFIQSFKKEGWVILMDGGEIPVSDRYKKSLLLALGQMGLR